MILLQDKYKYDATWYFCFACLYICKLFYLSIFPSQHSRDVLYSTNVLHPPVSSPKFLHIIAVMATLSLCSLMFICIAGVFHICSMYFELAQSNMVVSFSIRFMLQLSFIIIIIEQ